MYRDDIQRSNEFRQKYEEDKSPVDNNSYVYSGTRYPSGSKYKDMRAFHSVKHTIPLEEYLQNPANRIYISISTYDKSTFKTITSETIAVKDEETAYESQRLYEKMKLENPDAAICIGVN